MIDWQSTKFLAELYEKIKKQKTPEQLHKEVLESFEKDRLNLDIVRDMSKFFWGFFDTEEQREKYPDAVKSWIDTMQEGLKSYWGPSAKVTPDYKKNKFLCTLNDGREVWL